MYYVRSSRPPFQQMDSERCGNPEKRFRRGWGERGSGGKIKIKTRVAQVGFEHASSCIVIWKKLRVKNISRLWSPYDSLRGVGNSKIQRKFAVSYSASLFELVEEYKLFIFFLFSRLYSEWEMVVS